MGEFGLYDHPATEFTCRHCKGNAGYDPEVCTYCGPVCDRCFDLILTEGCPRHKGKLEELETKPCTWWLFWADEDWPADGVIEVEAASPKAAIEAGTKLMNEKAESGDGPKNWHWEYEPTDRKPNWIK